MMMVENALRRFSMKLSLTEVKKAGAVLSILIIASLAIALMTTHTMAIASAAYLFLLSGILLHAQRRLHVLFMASGAFIDVSLVLFLEFTRSAINTVIAGELSFLQRGHVLFSTLAVCLYFPTIFFGVKKIAGKTARKNDKTHIYFGRLAFAARTIGFILMFSLLGHTKTA